MGSSKKKKNDNHRKYIILGIVAIITVLLGITAYSIKTDRNLTFVEKGIKDTVLFIGKILNEPVKFIKDKTEVMNEKEDIYRKYQQLLENNGSVDLYETRIKELEKENEELRKLNDIEHSLSEYEVIKATVIRRNMGYWFDTVTIDKGSTSGIGENMPVMVQGRLIGYVSNVSNFTSTIKLLTNPTSSTSISVKIELSEGKYAYGLLTGYNTEENAYVVEGISDYTEIPMNAVVTTTGLADRFPSGILIGKVKSVTTDSFDLARIANVKPDTEINDIAFVTILKRKIKD